MEPLLEDLPGAPDGVSAAPDGGFWVALVSPVPPIAKLLKDPVVRALYAWLPTWARPPLKKWGAVVKVRGCLGCVLSRGLGWGWGVWGQGDGYFGGGQEGAWQC